MNEYQRQAYLSALGVENYMPRWLLAAAPAVKQCDLPVFNFPAEQNDPRVVPEGSVTQSTETSNNLLSKKTASPLAVADVLRDLSVELKPQKAEMAEVQEMPAPAANSEMIAPFALSIWRPGQELLVIDSRNSRLALPTEKLLSNILPTLLVAAGGAIREEVIRWPLVENAQVARTTADARSALQVWLEVELERRPVKYLLLMGENSTRYLLPEYIAYHNSLWQKPLVENFAGDILITPSLVELLQQPTLKRELWHALQSWNKVE